MWGREEVGKVAAWRGEGRLMIERRQRLLEGGQGNDTYILGSSRLAASA